MTFSKTIFALLVIVSSAAIGATEATIRTSEGRKQLVRQRLEQWKASSESQLDEAACSVYNATITWPENTGWGDPWSFEMPYGYVDWAEKETNSVMQRAVDYVVELIADPIKTATMPLPNPAVTGKQVYKGTIGSFELFKEISGGNLAYAKPTLSFTDEVAVDIYSLDN